MKSGGKKWGGRLRIQLLRQKARSWGFRTPENVRLRGNVPELNVNSYDLYGLAGFAPQDANLAWLQ